MEGKNKMWMEAKIMCTVIAMVMIAIVISQIFYASMFLVFILFVAIGMMVFGDMIIGFKVSDYKPLFDPTPRGKELMELQLLDGRILFINTTKGAYGKRSFRVNKEDASVINDGDAGFILPNGNHGFRSHERFDRNIDPVRAKALQNMPGNNVKEMYYAAKEELGLDKEGVSDGE